MFLDVNRTINHRRSMFRYFVEIEKNESDVVITMNTIDFFIVTGRKQ